MNKLGFSEFLTPLNEDLRNGFNNFSGNVNCKW